MPYQVIDPFFAKAAPVTPFGVPQTSVGKTLASMDDELLLYTANRTDVDSTKRRSIINDAYIEMAQELNLPELRGSFAITTDAAQPLYALPANVNQVLEVVWVSGENPDYQGGLVKLDFDAYRQLPLIQDDVPTRWLQYGTTLVFWPGPSGAYNFTVDAVFDPLPLVDDTDSPVFRSALHRGILLKARQLLYDAVGETDKISSAWQSYQNFLNSIPDPAAAAMDGVQARVHAPRSEADMRRLEGRSWYIDQWRDH